MMAIEIMRVDRKHQESIGSYGGIIELEECSCVDAETNEVSSTYTYLGDITLGEAKLIRLSSKEQGHREALHNLILSDEQIIRHMYSLIKLPEDLEGLADFVCQVCLERPKICTRGVFKNDEMVGFLMATIDGKNMRLAPYARPSERSTGLMKQAYTTLVCAYEKYANISLSFGATDEDNIAMGKIFEEAGLVRINEAPCSLIANQIRANIYKKPINKDVQTLG